MSPSISHTVEIRQDSVSESEAASLQGKPAKTPIIAGAVCGGVLLIAWIVGFSIYFRKRYNRKKRKRLAEEGKCDPPPEKVNPNASTDRFIISPDPAVLMGIAKPGEMMYKAKSRTSEEGRRPSMSSRRPTHAHRKSHSHSKSRPASPKGRSNEVDEMQEPLNPHSTLPQET